MKPFVSFTDSVLFSLVAVASAQEKTPAPAPAAPEAPAPSTDKAATFRRFTDPAGKTLFYAVVTSKTGSSVTLRLQNGKMVTQSLRSLLPDLRQPRL